MLSRYSLGSRLDRTYLSDVYRGVEKETGRTVVVKFNGSSAHAPILERIVSLNHPRLLVPFDFFMHEGSLVEVSAYCDWPLLSKVRQEVPVGKVTYIGVQLGDALAVLHDNGIIHHDVREENLFVAPDLSELRLFDFNCARAPYYLERGLDSRNDIPPEAKNGRCQIDFKWDVYQAGGVLHSLTHHYDWTARKKVSRAGVSEGLLEVVRRAQGELGKRYSSGRELADALKGVH